MNCKKELSLCEKKNPAYGIFLFGRIHESGYEMLIEILEIFY